MKTSKLFIAVLVLQSLMLLGQWTGSGSLAPVHAQIPDAGGQRIQLVEELKNTNAKLDKLIELLQSGEVQVKVASEEKK